MDGCVVILWDTLYCIGFRKKYIHSYVHCKRFILIFDIGILSGKWNQHEILIFLFYCCSRTIYFFLFFLFFLIKLRIIAGNFNNDYYFLIITFKCLDESVYQYYILKHVFYQFSECKTTIFVPRNNTIIIAMLLKVLILLASNVIAKTYNGILFSRHTVRGKKKNKCFAITQINLKVIEVMKGEHFDIHFDISISVLITFKLVPYLCFKSYEILDLFDLSRDLRQSKSRRSVIAVFHIREYIYL